MATLGKLSVRAPWKAWCGLQNFQKLSCNGESRRPKSKQAPATNESSCFDAGCRSPSLARKPSLIECHSANGRSFVGGLRRAKLVLAVASWFTFAFLHGTLVGATSELDLGSLTSGLLLRAGRCFGAAAACLGSLSSFVLVLRIWCAGVLGGECCESPSAAKAGLAARLLLAAFAFAFAVFFGCALALALALAALALLLGLLAALPFAFACLGFLGWAVSANCLTRESGSCNKGDV